MLIIAGGSGIGNVTADLIRDIATVVCGLIVFGLGVLPAAELLGSIAPRDLPGWLR